MEDFDDELLEQELAQTEPDLDSFPADLLNLVKKDAKLYLKSEQTFANVESADSVAISLNLGTKKVPHLVRMSVEDFKRDLVNDKIVARSRVTAGTGEEGAMRITPRKAGIPQVLTNLVINDINVLGPNLGPAVAPPIASQPLVSMMQIYPVPEPIKLSKAFINPSKGLFSLEPKQDFIEIEYREVVQKHTLELNTVQLEQLKKLGIIKE